MLVPAATAVAVSLEAGGEYTSTRNRSGQRVSPFSHLFVQSETFHALDGTVPS